MPAAIPFIPAAIAAVGVISGASSASKARKAQEKSARDATAAETAAQQSAQAFQQKQADQARADSEPWRQAGIGALNKLAATPDFTGASVATDPGYQFGLSEGMKGMTNSAAARGNLLSGAALKAASRYNNDYATTKFDAAFQRDSQNKNRLATLAGVGQTSASQNGQNAMQLGQSVGNGLMSSGMYAGNNLMGAGNARASGYLAQNNVMQNGLNQGLSLWNQYQNSSRPDNTYMSSNTQNVQPGSSGTWNG